MQDACQEDYMFFVNPLRVLVVLKLLSYINHRTIVIQTKSLVDGRIAAWGEYFQSV